MEASETVAYGYLGLTPMEFSNLQVGEFYKILEGRQSAEKRLDEKRAYFLSWLVNVQLEHPVATEEILIPLYPEVKAQMEERKRKQREEDEAILRKEFGLDEKKTAIRRPCRNQDKLAGSLCRLSYPRRR